MLRALTLICASFAVCQAAPFRPGVHSAWDEFKDHLFLSDDYVRDKRIFITGDVHGCMDEVRDILTEAELLTADGTGVVSDGIVIFAGDFVNKGPFSPEVIRFVMSNENVYAATGNHEINVLEDPNSEEYPWSAELTAEEWDWLRDLPWSVNLRDIPGDHDITVVHAGLMPDVPLAEQEEFVMTRMRNLIPDGDGWIASDERDEGFAWATIWEGPQHVVFGHDAGRGRDDDGNMVIQEEDFATGLDTRCVTGGFLTGVWVPVRERNYISVQCEEYDNLAD